MITIVSYGVGNTGSLRNMFKRLGTDVKIETEPENIKKANKIVLPGVGAFDTAMENINKKTGLVDVLNTKALVEKIPILGICLGMQILANKSEEGKLNGLGWINASVKKFPNNKNLKVPHMGWNYIDIYKKNALTQNLHENSRFYFVHSFYVKTKNRNNSFFKTNYGVEFDSGIQKDNIFGVQFHPEKSHKFGIKILKNFLDI